MQGQKPGTCEVCEADAFVRTVYLRGTGAPLKVDVCSLCAWRPW